MGDLLKTLLVAEHRQSNWVEMLTKLVLL